MLLSRASLTLRRSAALRLAARPPPLATFARCSSHASSADDKPQDAESQEEIDRVALQLSRLLRVLAVGWLGFKVYEIFEGGNTYLIAPSLTLVRSKNADNRESGIWRVKHWHSSDAALAVVVDQGGIEALLAALPSAQPASRVTILELLGRMAPNADARTRMLANDAASRATAGCGGLADAAAAERCLSLASSLRQALLEPASPS